jgi:hypothetical protein
VTEQRCSPGELTFHARIGGHERSVRLRAGEGGTATGADPVLAACLLPAMASGGGRLTLPGPVSPRLLRTQREYQAVQRAWSREWEFQETPLEEVEVIAPTRPPEPPSEPDRVAAFFSAGVDSWSTLLDNPEITDLIFVGGIDLLPGLANHAKVAPEVEARVREVAGELGLALHTVETDLRALSDPLVRWEAYFPSACITVAHFLAPRFGRVLLASGLDHEVDDPVATARLVDHLWSSERLEVADDGGRYSRVEKTRRIVAHPLVQRSLRVCWENRDGAYNCGRCRKCLMTMITLEALGALRKVETFPSELDLTDVATIRTEQVVVLSLWEDVLDLVREEGRADLAPAVETVVDRGKRTLGLPPGYRRRRRGGQPPRDAAATLAELLESRSWRITAPLRRAAAALRRLRNRA